MVNMSTFAIPTSAPLVLGPESAGVLLSPEEFDAVTEYDDGFRYELIRGLLIDRFNRILTVYRNVPGEQTEVVLTEQETYRTPLLPGFELPLARLLIISDRWI